MNAYSIANTLSVLAILLIGQAMKKLFRILLTYFQVTPWFFGLFFGLFLLRGILLLDPDFGWHMRMGQLILQHGIPSTDQLSYTMPSYPVIDHEWLTNIALATLYPLIGKVGLAVIFAGVATGALWVVFARLPKQIRQYAFLPFLLGGVDLVGFVGVRPQVLTWGFFALFFTLLLTPKLLRRLWWGLPLLMLVWVNLHGGFAYGVALVGGWWVVDVYQHKAIRLGPLLFLLSILLITCVNPYGIRLWHELWMQASDSSLRWKILEWQPAFFSPDVPFWFLFVMSGIFVWRCRSNLSLLQKVYYVGFGLAALSSVRNIPLWLLVVLPMLPRFIMTFAKEAGEYPFGRQRFTLAYTILTSALVVSMVLWGGVLFYVVSFVTEKSFYPVQAIQYLQQHPVGGHIFASQEWNGYLTWKLPGERVFIHGMMPSWRDHQVPGESSYAFGDYQAVMLGKVAFLDVAKQYAITTVILPGHVEPRMPVSRYGAILTQVRLAGWRKVYADTRVVIYERGK